MSGISGFVAREMLGHDPARLTFGVALRCTPAIALIMAGGVLTQQHGAAAIMAGSALTVGLGVQQKLTRSPLGAMLIASVGMALAAALGTVAGLSGLVLLAAIAAAGFGAALLTVLGASAQWLGQQCAIALLVAGSFPGGVAAALGRSGLVIGGSVLQILLVEASFRFGDVAPEFRGARHLLRRTRAAMRVLGWHLRRNDPNLRFAATAAVVLAASAAFERALLLPNGYWAAMTALLLFRRDFHSTWHRSASRVAGTLLGGGGALAPSLAGAPHRLVDALVPTLAFLCFGFQQFSYAALSVWLTALIVILLSSAGLEGELVARNRIIGTAIGAGFALAGHIHFRRRI